MAQFNPVSMMGSFFGGGGGLMDILVILALGGCALAVCGAIIYYFYNKRRWNLKVEFKLPRSVKYNASGKVEIDDVNGFVDSEWGKGAYIAKTGVVWLKRKKKRKVAMKPFQVSRYIQGNGTITVIQIGAEDYIPVIPESYLIYYDDKSGEQATLLDLKADTSESKAWKSQFEREAKKAFSISNILEKYATAISIGLVIFLWGIQLLLLYNRMGK